MHKMIATTMFSLAAFTPVVASASIPEHHRFTRDGETYVYTVTTEPARQVIDGYAQSNGDRFHLIVRNGLVSGVSNGKTVSFRVPSAGVVKPIETAAR